MLLGHKKVKAVPGMKFQDKIKSERCGSGKEKHDSRKTRQL